MLQKIKKSLVASSADPRPSFNHARRFQPEPPPGFVRRSDPNYYFLARR